jgi:hypothetical protein
MTTLFRMLSFGIRSVNVSTAKDSCWPCAASNFDFTRLLVCIQGVPKRCIHIIIRNINPVRIHIFGTFCIYDRARIFFYSGSYTHILVVRTETSDFIRDYDTQKIWNVELV